MNNLKSKAEKLIYIADLFKNNVINFDSASNSLLELLDSPNRWVSVAEKEPPKSMEVLVKSPDDVVSIASWRPAYKIFSNQSKHEDSFDWSWKLI